MAGTRPCSKCAKRRQKIEALRAKRKAQGKPVQAAALGAVLAVSEAVGKVAGTLPEKEAAEFKELAARSIADQLDAAFVSKARSSGEEPNGPHSGSDESGGAEVMAGSEG